LESYLITYDVYYQTTDRMLSFVALLRYDMHQKVEINSFSTTKLKNEHDHTKYDIEVSIDEIESEEDHAKLKYRFVLLSNPTNVKISIDGLTTIYGNQQEMIKHLSNDEKNIPRVVNVIYQEIFPFLYITSKTMHIPCPAYKLADIAKTSQHVMPSTLEQVEAKHTEIDPFEDKSVNGLVEIENHADIETETPESLIQEPRIHTV